MDARAVVAILLLVAALLVGALGLHVFFTERGVANEIKGFVLILMGSVLGVGGCVLWELGAIRRILEEKNPK
jgi:hypothetical protein